MHNAPLRTFTLFIRPDERSKQIAEKIRQLNSKSSQPLVESADGDFVIAIGGDGTFIDAVTKTNFSKKKLYTGVHTGTLGFLQDLDEKDIFSLFQYLNFSQILNTRKVYIPVAKVFLKNGITKQFNSLNEVLISGKDNSKIIIFPFFNFSKYSFLSSIFSPPLSLYYTLKEFAFILILIEVN